MPYCPKCDMEFVDGITVCSDCGEPLISAEQAALLQEAEQQKAEQIQFEEELGIAKAQAHKHAETEPETEAAPKSTAGAYVTKRQRLEDMKASISAFFMMGGIFCAFGVLCFLKLVKLPLAAGPMTMFQSVLTIMGIACLVVAVMTKSSATRMFKEAEIEDALTKRLLGWFSDTYKGEEMDRFLLTEDPSLDEQELYLKRFELIQDYLITSQDLPEQGYVDYLCEEIYGRVFEG